MKNLKFKIPIMGIQDYLHDLKTGKNGKLEKLRQKIDEIVLKEGDNWGVTENDYYFEYDLEVQWYPIFCTENRRLADYVLKLI